MLCKYFYLCRIPSRINLVILVVLLGLVGCKFRKPLRDYPSQSEESFSTSGIVEMPNLWWTAFDNPDLNSQVNQALGDNLTLNVALHRLRAAKAVARREASDFFPDVDGLIDTNSTFGTGPSQTRVTWGLDASYQVDLWGEIQSRVEAEEFRAEATLADYHAVALALSAEIARTWFSLIEAHAQLELLSEQTETNRTGLVLLEARFGRGIILSPDVLRQRQLVESTLEQEVVVRAQVEVLEHQLAVLLGQLPQSVSYAPGTDLPELPPMPKTGLSSVLLTRRPDVRSDYLAFVAADRDLASAVSAQYPRLNLTGSVLNIAERPETLFRDWFISIGGQLVAPLFDGDQRRSEVDRTSEVASQLFNEYGQTVLNAFREVEDNLALERYQIQRIERIGTQATLAQQATKQLREQLLIGNANFLDVLSANQSHQRLQRDLLSARLDLILIRINLYLALAGDFDTSPEDFTELPLEVPDLRVIEQLPPTSAESDVDKLSLTLAESDTETLPPTLAESAIELSLPSPVESDIDELPPAPAESDVDE